MLKMCLSIPSISCNSAHTGQSLLLPGHYTWVVWQYGQDGRELPYAHLSGKSYTGEVASFKKTGKTCLETKGKTA